MALYDPTAIIALFTVNGASVLTWPSMPSALTEATGTRTRLPLYLANFARLTCHVVAPGAAGATLTAQVSNDNGQTWATGPAVSIAAAGLQVSGFVNIPQAFQADCMFRMVGQGGNGATSPQIGMTTVQLA